MKLPRLLFPAALLFGANLLLAQTPSSPRTGATFIEINAGFSHAGRATIREGSRPLGRIDSSLASGSFVTATPVSAKTLILAGVGAQSLNFDAPAGSPVPDELGSLSAKLGVNYQIDPRWTVRFDADPGVYGDSVGSGDFGMPVALRVIFAASQELQWAIGINVDTRSGHPLAGGVGVRWQFAPDWTLSVLLPAPRIEWAVTKNFGLFAGASAHGGAFRVADNFGRTRGRPELDGQTVDYREISVGVGARWQITPETTLRLGVGRMLDRRFEFHDRNLLLNGDGAATVEFALKSAF